jgi:hypothetical protein
MGNENNAMIETKYPMIVKTFVTEVDWKPEWIPFTNLRTYTAAHMTGEEPF